MRADETAMGAGSAASSRAAWGWKRLVLSGRDPYRARLIWVFVLFTGTLVLTLGLIFLAHERPEPDPLLPVAAAMGVHPNELRMGEAVYQLSCALCHGQQGEGVARLGKPIRNSEFVGTRSDAELFSLIVAGRAMDDPLNTTGALMPARAGFALSDAQIRGVVRYMRTLQEPGAATASLDAWLVYEPGTAGRVREDMSDEALSLASAPGRDKYVAACSACHGPSGEGVEGVGLPLRDSEFITGLSDGRLLTFIKMGRATWDPDNKTGLDMPPRGGNPALNDADLGEIIRYLRALNPEG